MNRTALNKVYGRKATGCSARRLDFQGTGGRRVEAAFDAGHVTSDGGLLLLREMTVSTDVLRAFAACFSDRRDPARVEHTVEDLVAQRVYGIIQGYEDLNDHESLRDDPALALAVGKKDVTGAKRRRRRDRGHPLAGKSTLNRLELAAGTIDEGERYKKISYDDYGLQRVFVDSFLSAHAQAPAEIILDIDATDDPLHGMQEGRFFHGYYNCYCYMPLYTFCGDHLLGAALHTADKQPAAHAVEELERIVAQIVARWPDTRIVIRGDSGFCRDELMSWCEANGIGYILGLQKNKRLVDAIASEMELARAEAEHTGDNARVFKDFRYRTRDSWSCERRVVGKAEFTTDKENPRFVATNIPSEHLDARALYEDLYCARGDMENRIKEQQLGLFADRTSTRTLRANQLRLWFSSLAYVILAAFRRLALAGTTLASAQVSTIRTRLLKVGALITVSVRRINFSLSKFCPVQRIWEQALANLRRHAILHC